jgi:hypothetical protein
MAAVEPADSYVDRLFSPQGIAFLTDAIIIQRYREIDGELKRAMAVVKRDSVIGRETATKVTP